MIFAATKVSRPCPVHNEKGPDFQAQPVRTSPGISSAMMKIPGLTLLLSNPSDMSIGDLGCNSQEAGDTITWTESISAQRVTQTLPTMDKRDSLVQLSVEVTNLSILPKRAMETQDSGGSKRQKIVTTATPEPVRCELTVEATLSTPPETQEKNHSQAPETASLEALTKKQRKKRNRLHVAEAALREKQPTHPHLPVQQAAVTRKLAAQQVEAVQELGTGQVAMSFVPAITNVAPIAAVISAIPAFVPTIPPVVIPPIVVPSKTISAENWLRAGVPKSPFNKTPYSRSELETAWKSFSLSLSNIYQFPIPHLVIVRHHFLSTLWRYSTIKGTHHITTPTIGGIGLEAMRFLTHHLGCPVILQTAISNSKHVYVIELKYVPSAPRKKKGFKFLHNALSVEEEKEALTSLEEAWRAKLACATIENSSQSTAMTAAPSTSSARSNVAAFPKAKSQSEGGQVIRVTESRLAELRSQLVQAKKVRSPVQNPDEPIPTVDAPPVPSPRVRVPRHKATDFFDDIAPKRIPSPPLTVPDERDHWGKLNYEKKMEKVDLGAIDTFLALEL